MGKASKELAAVPRNDAWSSNDGAVVKTRASFAANAVVEAPVHYERSTDRRAAAFGHELPKTGFADCFAAFPDVAREHGVRTETIEESEWDGLKL